jgi:hypothetical protein
MDGLISAFKCSFFERIDEVKLSSTPEPEHDEQYKDRHRNYEAKCHARWRHRGEDLIWRTRMQKEEYNLNQRTRQPDIREAHLRRRECRCDRRETEICAIRMRGMDTETESGSE